MLCIAGTCTMSDRTCCACKQERYAAGVKDILQRTFDGGDLKPADIICKDGKLAPQVRSRLVFKGSGFTIRHKCREGLSMWSKVLTASASSWRALLT
jgi:hypothetical protein